jgi:hypothetical protein
MTLWDLLKQAISPAAPPPRKRARSRPVKRKPPPVPAKAGQTTGQPRAADQWHVKAQTTGHRKAGDQWHQELSHRKPAKPGASMEERYERVTREMLEAHGVRVRRWRTHMSGIAWQVRYRDGTVKKLIESPRPKGPMSAAIFLHEIGHHAIGFNTYKPRCLEEYHAWRFAIEQMERLGLNVTDGVRRRMHNSLRYAVEKARRRGIREVPGELAPFVGAWKKGQ